MHGVAAPLASEVTRPPATEALLRDIVANASFLHERLDSSSSLLATADLRPAAERIGRWSRIVARVDPAGLRKRVEWDGLTEQQLIPILGAVALKSHAPLPPWALVLQEIMQAASPNFLFQPDALTRDTARSIPFVHLLMAGVTVARQRLTKRVQALALALLSADAHQALERQLLAQLHRVSADALHEEFSAERGNGRYREFVVRHLGEGLTGLFEKYPVLGRLIASTVSNWVDATADLVERLDRDLPDIERLFCVSPAVTGIESGLSDLHHGGRSVLLLTFANDLRLVYKPKDMALEAAFNDFLRWCRHERADIDLRALRVLNRDTHGWVEFVSHEACADDAAARRFYTRAGMLLALVHVLRGTDCHNENLIASGEHLVLIDAETLFHHEARTMEGLSATESGGNAATARYWNSVLRTGLLPRWNFSADNRSFSDVSGLGGSSGKAQRVAIWRWYSVNTDDMCIRSELVAPKEEKNLPFIGDKRLTPDDYRAQVAQGFRRVYDFLTERREALLSDSGPLALLRSATSRFIFRPTRIYSMVLQRALQPSCLRSGVDFSLELEHLSCAFLASRTRPESWPILRAEQRAMERLDIPFFSGRGQDDVLYADGNPLVPRYFQRSSEADVRERLGRLDAGDLACQLALIEGCFLAIRAQGVPNSGTQREPYAELPAPDSTELIDRAIRLADEIAARAIPESDGGLGWIGLRHVFEAERVQLQVLSNGLYDGRGGIAVFFAALFRVTGEHRFRDLALRALALLRRELAEQDAASGQRFARFTGIGGAAGLGSMIYSLVKVHALADETGLLTDAQRLADLISPELIQADQRLDVMGGAAGAILGLLALHDVAPRESVLRTAALCGDHLLAHRHGEPGHPRAWRTLSERPLTGFSHGAAGISYALLRLHAASRNIDYRLAAMEGMQYERDVFSPADANWPDFREADAASSSCLTRWCHGAPGIGIGRLASLPIARTGQIEEDIRIALRTTREFPMDAVDHLCCGNFGRIDVLLTGAQRLGNDEWRRVALGHAANVLARADRTGAFRLFPHLSEAVFDPGFFRGTAGIGYGLLRLARDDLPSVLTWA